MSYPQSLQGIDRVANIVRAMKEFSHPDKREKSAIDLNRAIKTTLTVAHNEFKYVADVVEELSPDLPSVQGYPSELNQVFLNLMVNAAHAIGEVVQEGKGRGKITVRSALGDRCVIVSISDTGIGIKPEVRDLIDRAAKSRGKNRTDFILDSARLAAEDALLDQVIMNVSPKAFAAFSERLSMPPKPNTIRGIAVRALSRLFSFSSQASL